MQDGEAEGRKHVLPKYQGNFPVLKSARAVRYFLSFKLGYGLESNLSPLKLGHNFVNGKRGKDSPSSVERFASQLFFHSLQNESEQGQSHSLRFVDG